MNDLQKIKAVKECYYRLRVAKEQYEHWKSIVENVTLRMDEIKVKTGNNTNKTEDHLISYCSAAENYENALREYITVLNEANEILFRMEDTREMQIMYKRHIAFESFDQIGNELGYTDNRIRQIHRSVCARLAREN